MYNDDGRILFHKFRSLLFRRTKAWLPWAQLLEVWLPYDPVCPSVGQSIKLSAYSHRSTCYFYFETDAYWGIVRCCCRKVVLKLNTYKNKRNEIVWQFTERMESKKEIDNRCCCPIVTKNASHPFKNPANSADIVGSKTSLKPGLSVVNVHRKFNFHALLGVFVV